MASEKHTREYGEQLIEMVKTGRMTRRQLLVRASVFGLSATAAGQLLGACGSSDSEGSSPSASASSGTGPEPVMGGTLKVVISPSITDIDPVAVYDTGGATLVAQFCEYLIDMKEDLSLEGRLAESWTPNDTGDEWTFKLRQGVKFTDGSPFEAEDVVATMDRLVDPKGGSAALAALGGILSPGGTKAVDASTVQFNLDKPFADFPYLVCTSSYNTVMLPRTYEGDWAKNPVGTGPWLLDQYVAKQKCVAVKNPDYWRKDAQGRQLPYMDRIEWPMVADESASALQLQSGAIDVKANTPFQGAQALFNDPTLRVDAYKSTGLRALNMNNTMKPFTDPKVRQALALCLDRDAINQALFDGKSTAGYDSFFNSDVYPNMPQNAVRSQDHEKAKALLAEAGYPDGVEVTLTTMGYLEVPQFAQLIKAQCAPAGIDVKIEQIDYNKWYAGDADTTPWLNAQFGIVEWGPRPTPGVFVQAMLLPDSAWNSVHWDNQTFVDLFGQYMSTTDEAARLDLATQLSRIQQDETPMIVAFFITQLRAQKKTVHGIQGPGAFYCDVSQAFIATS
jgi:peptide/nickel transport system substrate-binding protein